MMTYTEMETDYDEMAPEEVVERSETPSARKR